ncbi:MAG: phosphoglucosamine mutase [Verrucomicrobiae bacterium]|nr:phosphoglucosamine mutase [Verrucomicrobiae bacterium]
MNQRKLFGTDGIRGVANRDPVTPENAFRLAGALTAFLKSAVPSTAEPLRIVVGRDPRRSGEMLEAALVAGLTAAGANALLTGVLPTPGVALLTREEKAAAGIVISASHNPAEDNGLKLFCGDGTKFDDAAESKIETLMSQSPTESERPIGAGIGTTTILSTAKERYIAACKKTVPSLSLAGWNIALDMANGAASHTTPQLLQELGATVHLFHATPDGMNINQACGSTHGEEISRLVRETGAQLGLAHDGDADRLLLSDEEGNLVDGDEVLAMIGLAALRAGTLKNKTLVATVMSNFGLDETLAEEGGKVLRTPVGDRYVMEAMLQGDFNIGGEQSGHLIFRDHSSTGDGLVAALQILQLMQETKKPLSLLRRCLKKYPQAQRNLRVREKKSLEELRSMIPLIGQTEKELEGQGRVLLRYSGTEPLLRLLVEGKDSVTTQSHCDALAAALGRLVGAPSI